MKKYLCHLSILAMLLVWQVFADDTKTEWGSKTNGVRMSISFEVSKMGVQTNRPVKLLMRLKNFSTNEISRVGWQSSIESDDSFTFEIASPSKKDISPSTKLRFIPGSGSSRDLTANQTIEFNYDLSERCKFDEVGTYTIIAKKEIWSPKTQKQFTVTSNPLYLSVVSHAEKTEEGRTNNSGKPK